MILGVWVFKNRPIVHDGIASQSDSQEMELVEVAARIKFDCITRMAQILTDESHQWGLFQKDGPMNVVIWWELEFVPFMPMTNIRELLERQEGIYCELDLFLPKRI